MSTELDPLELRQVAQLNQVFDKLFEVPPATPAAVAKSAIDKCYGEGKPNRPPPSHLKTFQLDLGADTDPRRHRLTGFEIHGSFSWDGGDPKIEPLCHLHIGDAVIRCEDVRDLPEDWQEAIRNQIHWEREEAQSNPRSFEDEGGLL